MSKQWIELEEIANKRLNDSLEQGLMFGSPNKDTAIRQHKRRKLNISKSGFLSCLDVEETENTLFSGRFAALTAVSYLTKPPLDF